MGADGGSFTHRSEVVKTKAKAATVDKRNQLLAAWFTCALSKRDLEEPLVADALGKIYNKDALLEFLLAPPPSLENPISSRPFGQDGWLAASHLRSLKDVQTLQLTPANSIGQDSLAGVNATTQADKGGQIEYGKARWQCPISMRGMNGSVKFVYIKGCGCVASEVGLKEMAGVGGASPKDSSDKENDEQQASKAVCPICGTTLPGSTVETVTLNPVGEEKDAMLKAWNEKVAREEKEKAEKKANKKKKRKEGDSGTDALDAEKVVKKAKAAAKPEIRHPAPSINKKLPSMPEAKKPVSAAIASLYAPKNPNKEKLSPFFSSGYSRVG